MGRGTRLYHANPCVVRLRTGERAFCDKIQEGQQKDLLNIAKLQMKTLSAGDDKHTILHNGIHTLAYRQWRSQLEMFGAAC
jgi:hypothetical protein